MLEVTAALLCIQLFTVISAQFNYPGIIVLACLRLANKHN